MVAVYFQHTLYSFFGDTEVGGHKYIGYVESASFQNGFMYLEFGYPRKAREKEGASRWVRCRQMNEVLERYFRYYVPGWVNEQGFEYVSEYYENGYKAYLRKGSDMFFVWRFSDFAGSPLAPGEETVCSTQAGTKLRNN